MADYLFVDLIYEFFVFLDLPQLFSTGLFRYRLALTDPWNAMLLSVNPIAFIDDSLLTLIVVVAFFSSISLRSPLLYLRRLKNRFGPSNDWNEGSICSRDTVAWQSELDFTSSPAQVILSLEEQPS